MWIISFPKDLVDCHTTGSPEVLGDYPTLLCLRNRLNNLDDIHVYITDLLSIVVNARKLAGIVYPYLLYAEKVMYITNKLPVSVILELLILLNVRNIS